MISQPQAKKEDSMGSSKVEDIKKSRKMFEFDPTIHAGHILTVLTIIFCTIGAWYDMKSSLIVVKEENSRQEKEISEIRQDQKDQTQAVNESISALALMNRQEMVKMRDDMNQWFMRLSDKLDAKADKK